jgi:hypothetical protein
MLYKVAKRLQTCRGEESIMEPLYSNKEALKKPSNKGASFRMKFSLANMDVKNLTYTYAHNP